MRTVRFAIIVACAIVGMSLTLSRAIDDPLIAAILAGVIVVTVISFVGGATRAPPQG